MTEYAEEKTGGQITSFDVDDAMERWSISAEAVGDREAWLELKFRLSDEVREEVRKRLAKIGVIVF